VDSDLELSESENSNETSIQEKSLAINKFKKYYSGGYLGYNHVHNFGNVLHIITSDDYFNSYVKDLEPRFKEYLNEIPENISYTILPILKWQRNGGYKSVTISKSIKITRFSSANLLALAVADSLVDTFYIYDFQGLDITLFIMGRPWLSADDFNVKFFEVTDNLDKQIEKETLKGFSAFKENSTFFLWKYHYG